MPSKSETTLRTWLRQRAHGMRAARGVSIHALLAMLVLATALPLVLVLAWSMTHETGQRRRAAEESVVRVAERVALQARAMLDEEARIAALLAARPAVRRLHAAACDPLLDEMPALAGEMLAVSLVKLDGGYVCGAVPPPGIAADRDWAARIVEGPVIGPPERAGEGKPWVFTVSHPVRSLAGAIAGAVVVVMPTTAFLPRLANALPPGAAVSIVDAQGTMVARSAEHFDYVGRSTGGLLQRWRARGGSEQAQVAAGLDGVRRVFALRSLGGSGWYAVAGVPVAAIYAPANAVLLQYGIVAAGVLAGCAGLVVVIGARISRPLRSLGRLARRVGEGDLEARAPERGPVELATVAYWFNRMLEHLGLLQQQLVESEERHRMLLQKLSRNVPGMLFLFRIGPDGRGRIPFASEHLRTMFELEPAQVEHDAQPLQDRVHVDDRARVAATIAESHRTLLPFAAEYRVDLPGAGVRHYLTRSMPEVTGDGSVLWWGCTVDVSELKAAQGALQEVNTTLEQRIQERTAALASANEALEAFSYSVAHDLRAPLRAVEGFADAIPEAIAQGRSERALHLSQRLVANAKRMDLLIDGFLQLARAGAPPQDGHFVDQQCIVQEVLAELQPSPAARIEVQPLPRLRVDATTFRQVWWNLLANAVKYSSRVPAPRIEVSWRAGRDEVVFTVSDNGAGFDPAYADRLFLLFRRLHTDDEFEGTGVGLALTRRILESHGGRAWAVSQPGEGASFSFALPRARLDA